MVRNVSLLFHVNIKCKERLFIIQISTSYNIKQKKGNVKNKHFILM